MDKASALIEHQLHLKSLLVYLLASFELMRFLPLDSVIPLTPKPVSAMSFPFYNLDNEDRDLNKIWMLEMFFKQGTWNDISFSLQNFHLAVCLCCPALIYFWEWNVDRVLWLWIITFTNVKCIVLIDILNFFSMYVYLILAFSLTLSDTPECIQR